VVQVRLSVPTWLASKRPRKTAPFRLGCATCCFGSGHVQPSPDDRAVTAALVAAGRALDIPTNDHIIVGAGHYYSFAEDGAL